MILVQHIGDVRCVHFGDEDILVELRSVRVFESYGLSASGLTYISAQGPLTMQLYRTVSVSSIMANRPALFSVISHRVLLEPSVLVACWMARSLKGFT